MESKEVYCDNCQTFRPLVEARIPNLNGNDDYAAHDLRCGFCNYLVATVRQPAATPV
jgi:hypothetical protein